MVCKYIVKGFPNSPFGIGKSRPFRICAVTHQGQHALLSDFPKPLQVNGVPKYRRIIYLKVPGMHHDPCRGINCQRGSVLDAVVRLYKFHAEAAKVDMLPILHYLALHLRKHVVLPQLIVNNAYRQLCGINRHIDVPQYIRDCADMVLMAMGNEKPFHFFNVVFQIRRVWNYQVNAQHVIFWE